ncbi:MAG: hypothetical protein MZV64_63335 [Ignavibacteriales bacterium]|nr:hypothetical protein [Ignavibacteriales bacterium]
MPLEVRLAHFNHRLRDGAGGDERFVAAWPAAGSCPWRSGSADVRSYAARKKLNLEEAGRDLRYRFLRRAAAAGGATKIATGHTMTDQAETVLMRLMRGTGLLGLAGIAPCRRRHRPARSSGRCSASPGRTCGPGSRRRACLSARTPRTATAASSATASGPSSCPSSAAATSRVSSPTWPGWPRIAREDDELLDGLRPRARRRVRLRRRRGPLCWTSKTLPLLLPALARRVAREFLREARRRPPRHLLRRRGVLLGARRGQGTDAPPGASSCGARRGRVGLKKPAAARDGPTRSAGTGAARSAVAAGGPDPAGVDAGRRPSGRSAVRNDDRRRADLDAGHARAFR